MSGNSETTPLLSGFEDTIIEIPRDERRSEPQASIAAISVLSNTDLLMQIEEYLMGDRKHRNTNAFLLGAWQLRSTCRAIKAASDNYPAQIQLPFLFC